MGCAYVLYIDYQLLTILCQEALCCIISGDNRQVADDTHNKKLPDNHIINGKIFDRLEQYRAKDPEGVNSVNAWRGNPRVLYLCTITFLPRIITITYEDVGMLRRHQGRPKIYLDV
jgi:hypothetical protein